MTVEDYNQWISIPVGQTFIYRRIERFKRGNTVQVVDVNHLR
jgi:hypothetical protein